MKKNNETDALNEAIALLEDKRAKQLILFKEQFHITYESLKPINLAKRALHEVSSSPELKSNVLDSVIGLTTGYLSKKILFGRSHNPVKRILGTLLQFAITNVVSKHSETIKATGENILKRILKYRKEAKQEFQEDEIG